MRTYLKALREQAGLKQVDVARSLQISESYYSLIENGGRLSKMSIETAKKLSLLLSVSIDYIIQQEQLLQKLD